MHGERFIKVYDGLAIYTKIIASLNPVMDKNSKWDASISLNHLEFNFSLQEVRCSFPGLKTGQFPCETAPLKNEK